MKKNKAIKIIYVLIMITMMLMFFSNITTVNATSKINPGSPDATFTKPVGIIIGVFQVVTMGFAAIMVIVLAVKYMGSSPGERAEIKKHAIVYIVGAVLAFGATGVLQIIKGFTEETIK